MYKLLIVDDEPLVQVGIKSMLDWNSINVEVCGVASNGKAALDSMENIFPDIVITDIKMPIMSGLELAKECQSKYGDNSPAFVVLTSYEDFNLVREAMHCQVADYLVKLELTGDLLKDTITKITAELDDRLDNAGVSESYSLINSFYDKFFVSLLHNLFESEEQFMLQARELKLNFDSEAYICSYLEINSSISDVATEEAQINLYHSAFTMAQGLFSKYLSCYSIPLDLRHFAVIFCLKNSEKIIISEIISTIANVSKSLKDYYNASLISGTGSIVKHPLAITESYQYARDAFSNASSTNPNISFDELAARLDYKKSFNFAIFKESLMRSFEEFDEKLLNTTLSDIVDLFKTHPGHYLQAMDCASNILYMAISLIPNGEEVVAALFKDSPDGYRALYKFSTMEQIVSWLNHFNKSLCLYFTEHKKDTRKPIVTNIKRYIKDNIEEHLSLNEVAAVFGISPNYLSQLFTKYNDCGFNEYVTTSKIDEARRMLSSGDYKVYEVAEKLGFENAFYFSKVFKKVVGVPPTTFMSN